MNLDETMNGGKLKHIWVKSYTIHIENYTKYIGKKLFFKLKNILDLEHL